MISGREILFYLLLPRSKVQNGKYQQSRPPGLRPGPEPPTMATILITHELLGEIAGADYFERQNHRDLHVDWSPDSKWCVATYDARFGFDLCDVLEIQGRQFTQTKIGDHIHKELAGVVQAQAQSKDFDDPAGLLHVRIQPNEQLLLRVAARTNPKALEEIKTYYAFFEGTYDLKAKK